MRVLIVSPFFLVMIAGLIACAGGTKSAPTGAAADNSDAGPSRAADEPSPTPTPTPQAVCSSSEATFLDENLNQLDAPIIACVTECATQPDLQACLASDLAGCIAEKVDELSEGCSSCFGGQASCIQDGNCLASCIGGLSSAGSVQCLCDNGCSASFDRCAGTSSTRLCG